MPLPSPFNQWEHLKSVILDVQNEIVANNFPDVGGSAWSPDISTPRDSLRQACTIYPNDSALVLIARLLLYYLIVKGSADELPPIYAIPCENFHDAVTFKPQVQLLFYESKADAMLSDRIPVRAQISVRLMNTSPSTMTDADALNLANTIKNIFASGTPYTWKKGTLKASYRDLSNGYAMVLAVYDEATAKEVITKVLAIQGHTPDWDNLTISEPKKNYPVQPGTQVILGDTYKKPRTRPIADVIFRRAELNLHGMFDNVLLVCQVDYLDDEALVIF